MSTTSPASIGFIGLGAMGLGMASNLQRKSNYSVVGYDTHAPAAASFAAMGGKTGRSPRDAAKGSGFLICMTTNAQQVEEVLFNEETGVLQALPRNAIILVCSTANPTFYDSLPLRLSAAGRSDVLLLDCPVSGGTQRAAAGTLTIFASGSPRALEEADALLRDMSEKLYHIPGDIGSASRMKIVNQLLVGVHIAVAAEAMALAARAGLDTREVYDIVTNAAGNSWAFQNRVPHMLDGDWTPRSSLDIFTKDMGIVVSTARQLQFPVPLASSAEQLYISASSQGYGREDDAGLVRLFLPGTPDAVRDQAHPPGTQRPLMGSISNTRLTKVGMIGLGAMGHGMAASLLRQGLGVHGYDVYEPSVAKFLSLGGGAMGASSPSEAAKGADVVVLMVQNATQVEDVLFGSGRVTETLSPGATIILSSTVPPSFVRSLDTRLRLLERGIELVDAPVSGGVVRAANGTLTIICSGTDAAVSRVQEVLLAVTGKPGNLYHVQGGVGAASSIKLVNQLLAGVHITAAAEAMSFAARLGLDARMAFEVVKSSAGCSWMLENRVPQMLNGDSTPHSALAIFVKDLGIVLDEAKRLLCYAPLTSASHTLYISGAARGWSKESDSGVVRLWELTTGISVARRAAEEESGRPSQNSTALPEIRPLPLQTTLDALAPESTVDAIRIIREYVRGGESPMLVVLDDDPTGTQTCHDINVLMAWDDATLDAEFQSDPSGFFILTNSRALPSADAKVLLVEICTQVKKAAERAGKRVDIVLRGDSTLRGHLPEEPEAVEEVFGSFDGWVVAPFFLQGGRYTIRDVHYVAEGDVLVPASQTPFAQDAVFGYNNSNLRQYVLEKCGPRFDDSSFLSVTLEDIRIGGPAVVARKLETAQPGARTVIIVNAAAESDMHVFVAGLLTATARGRRFLFRTGAAFVSSRLGITGIPPLTPKDLKISLPGTTVSNRSTRTGGLIIAGSYVPKTTAQLKYLREARRDKLHVIELDVQGLIGGRDAASATVAAAAEDASRVLEGGADVLIMTSRDLITGHDAASSLGIGSRAAQALVELLEKIQVRPRYVISKGGITSSDVATKSLGMKRAKVLGQAAPGVPLWRCDEETSRHVGVPLIVFPGNVGGNMTLAQVVRDWAR